jgi:hypothetical protein
MAPKKGKAMLQMRSAALSGFSARATGAGIPKVSIKPTITSKLTKVLAFIWFLLYRS